jgi:DNA (cytosine-5)-methyltransferase 1
MTFTGYNYEFFAGGGMARLGLGLGWRCLLANDNDHDFPKSASYRANFSGGPELKVCDVARLKAADLPGRADLAWASPPCQDVSLAGDRAGLDGSRSGALWPFWRLMLGLRAEGRAPKMIVIENVTGLITSHSGADFDTILEALSAGGYNVGAVVIDAELFVPQSRERVFLIGVDKALPIRIDLVADGPCPPFHPPVLASALRRQRTQPLWWRLPIPPRRNTVFADLIEDHPIGVPSSSSDDPGELIAMMAPQHLAKVEAAKRAGRRMVGSLSKRMRPAPGGQDVAGQRVQRAEVRFDDVAGCLRVPAGGSSRQTIMMVDGDKILSRLLSAREAARLMGLPDSYRLPGHYNNAYALCGDGVAVPVVAHLERHLITPILSSRLASAGHDVGPASIDCADYSQPLKQES